MTELTPIELAAQVWCQSDTSHIVMDEVLCAAFADTLRDYGRAEYLRGLEDAARIAATRWDVLKETEAAHYRLSNMPFNAGNFGMNFTLAEESRDIAYAIRALAGEKT
jgi:hypothetical protein